MGIDLGTSFASAAVRDESGVRMVPLSPDIVVPSAAAVAPSGELLTGVAATSATVKPAALVRGFKRRLGDPSRLILDGASYSPAALMAAQLRDVLDDVTKTQAAPPDSVVLTCPAIWGPYRREHFAEVPRIAGVANYRLVTEPEAAATHYSRERRLGNGEVVAVYDLGGGTFDTTILRMGTGGMEIIGTPDGIEHMGGIDFDDTLVAAVDERLDGAISELDADEPDDATALAAIRELCVRGKEALTIEPDITLTIPLPRGPREVVISRLDFNEMISPSVDLTTEALHRTISSAGVSPDDLSAILLSGGSSRIPLVHQTVFEEFGKPIRLSLNPKHTVALGAATMATQPEAPPVPTVTTPHATAAAPLPTVTTSAASTSESASAAPGRAPSPPPLPATPNTATPPRSRGGKRWLIPAGAAAAISLIGVVVLIIAMNSSVPGSRPDAIPASANAPLQLYDGKVVSPWQAMIVAEKGDDWTSAELAPAGTEHGPVTAREDGEGGLRVTWDGSDPGQAYIGTDADTGQPQDLSRYFDLDGSLVFDMKVNQRPTGSVRMALRCGLPCHAKVPTTSLFERAPLGDKTSVEIPLRCFSAHPGKKWNPENIDAPWLVRSDGKLDVTFSNIRWEATTGTSATSCDQLS